MCPRCRRRLIAEGAFDGPCGSLRVVPPGAAPSATPPRVTRYERAGEPATWTLRCSPRCGGVSVMRDDHLVDYVRKALASGVREVPLH